MTADQNAPLNGNQNDVESWIKGTLESWFEEQKSDAFSPYQVHFRLALQPHEILQSIYQDLPRQRKRLGLSASPATVFRKALGRLLCEPEIYQRDFQVYFELLRLGSAIGSNEVIDSLVKMLRQHLLPAKLEVNDGDSTFEVNVLAQSVDTVLRAGFVGKDVVEFLRATFPYVRSGEQSASTIAIALARFDEARWALHFADLAEELTTQLEHDTHPKVRARSKASFRDRLVGVVGDELYVEGLRHLERSGALATLGWIITPDIARMTERAHTQVVDWGGRHVADELAAASAGNWNLPIGEVLPDVAFASG